MLKEVLKSQFHAALAMLEAAVQGCPDSEWDNVAFKNRFWHVAYHVLFYTDLYLSRSEEEFQPWRSHREEVNFLGVIPWEPTREAVRGEPFRRGDVLAYLNFCRQQAVNRLDETDLDAPSGFQWLPFGKLELQIYNIRHVQHHAAQLIERIRQATGEGMDWVGWR